MVTRSLLAPLLSLVAYFFRADIGRMEVYVDGTKTDTCVS